MKKEPIRLAQNPTRKNTTRDHLLSQFHEGHLLLKKGGLLPPQRLQQKRKKRTKTVLIIRRPGKDKLTPEPPTKEKGVAEGSPARFSWKKGRKDNSYPDAPARGEGKGGGRAF